MSKTKTDTSPTENLKSPVVGQSSRPGGEGAQEVPDAQDENPACGSPTAASTKSALLEALALKELPRAGWQRAGVNAPESVAAHSWGVAWLVLVLCPPTVDRGRALAMAILHDLAEVRVGDITPHDGVCPAEKLEAEREALATLCCGLASAKKLRELWSEYAAGQTLAARLVRACDKLDMALQAERYQQTQKIATAEFIQSAKTELAALGPAASDWLALLAVTEP